MAHSVVGGERLELGCESVHPVTCAAILSADRAAELVAVVIEHGAEAHGFTPAWYSRGRREVIAAVVNGAAPRR